jgi:hypothetical protein
LAARVQPISEPKDIVQLHFDHLACLLLRGAVADNVSKDASRRKPPESDTWLMGQHMRRTGTN